MAAKLRRLSATQQAHATTALTVVQASIAAYLKSNPALRRTARRCDLESVAMQAICMAAFTYDPAKSAVTTYFGASIRHALARAVGCQVRLDSRFQPSLIDIVWGGDKAPSRERSEQRAWKALRMLGAADRTLLEDRLIERVTLEQLGLEQHCDSRTIQKRVQRALENLRQAETDLP